MSFPSSPPACFLSPTQKCSEDPKWSRGPEQARALAVILAHRRIRLCAKFQARATEFRDPVSDQAAQGKTVQSFKLSHVEVGANTSPVRVKTTGRSWVALLSAQC